VGLEASRRLLRVEPEVLIGIGLALAALSGIPGVLFGEGFFAGQWASIRPAGFQNEIKIGTPIFFDIGVYLSVKGVVLLMIYSLEEHHHDSAARA